LPNIEAICIPVAYTLKIGKQDRDYEVFIWRRKD